MRTGALGVVCMWMLLAHANLLTCTSQQSQQPCQPVTLASKPVHHWASPASHTSSPALVCCLAACSIGANPLPNCVSAALLHHDVRRRRTSSSTTSSVKPRALAIQAMLQWAAMGSRPSTGPSSTGPPPLPAYTWSTPPSTGSICQSTCSLSLSSLSGERNCIQTCCACLFLGWQW